MTQAAAITPPQAVSTDRQTRKRQAITTTKAPVVEDVLRIYDGLAEEALPTVKASLSCYRGKRVCISIVAPDTLAELGNGLQSASTLEERMRARLTVMENEVERLNTKEVKRAKGLTLEEYDVRDALCGAISEFKELLEVSP